MRCLRVLSKSHEVTRDRKQMEEVSDQAIPTNIMSNFSTFSNVYSAPVYFFYQMKLKADSEYFYYQLH